MAANIEGITITLSVGLGLFALVLILSTILIYRLPNHRLTTTTTTSTNEAEAQQAHAKFTSSPTKTKLSQLEKYAPKSPFRVWWKARCEHLQLQKNTEIKSSSPEINISTIEDININPNNTTSDTSDTGFICAICLESIQDSDTIHALRCNHVFHDGCLERWFLGFHFCCPLCQAVFFGDVEGGKGVRGYDAV